MIKNFVILLSLLFSHAAKSTNEAPDYLSINTGRFQIKEKPLDSLLSVKDIQKVFNLKVCEKNERGFQVV